MYRQKTTAARGIPVPDLSRAISGVCVWGHTRCQRHVPCVQTQGCSEAVWRDKGMHFPKHPRFIPLLILSHFFFGHCTFRSQLLLLNSLWPSTFSYMTPKGAVTHSLRICTPGKSLLPEGAAWPLSGDNQTNRDFRHGLVASVWRAALAVIKVQCLWNKHFKFFILSFERGQARWGKLIHFYCQFFHRHPLNG